MSALNLLFNAEDKVDRWSAEFNYASTKLNLARMNKNMAYLISQYEPINSLGIDRDIIQIIFSYITHGNIKRLERDIKEVS